MEIETQLENIDNKIEKYNKKTDKLSKLVTSLISSLEQNQQTGNKDEILNLIQEKLNNSGENSSIEELKTLISEIKKDYSKNQKSITTKISDLKAAINKTNDTIENSAGIKSEVNDIYNIAGTINIDVNKLFDLVNEFKTNTDLSNQTISDNMQKIENLLSNYSVNLSEINTSPQTDLIKAEIKNLNDKFYLELLQLFDSLSFEEETEDLKDFIEDVLSSITIKTDENSEKLNNIMLQFKDLLNKIEGIEKAQNSISDYLKPEDADDLVYSFDDIQSDLAKMRLVLNDISNSVSSQELVEDLSEKIQKTGEQIDNISRLLGSNSADDENTIDIKEKIESLNEQVYDISVRTNKLILSNEDSTIELKNNLEIFKEVFDKANPEKLYELFYELTHYLNDVSARLNLVDQTTKASHTESVTIKNALVYVGEWLDNATTVLEELRTNTGKQKEKINIPDSTKDILEVKNLVSEGVANIFARIAIYEENTQKRLDSMEAKLDKLLTAKTNTKTAQNTINIDNLEAKLDKLLAAKAPAKTTSATQLKNLDKKFNEIETVLSKITTKLMEE